LLRQALLGLLSWQVWNRLLPLLNGLLPSLGWNRRTRGRASTEEEQTARKGF